ncbi:hypothetical protein BH11PSE2_BH11PSE2_12710 [soil metagenome]
MNKPMSSLAAAVLLAFGSGAAAQPAAGDAMQRIADAHAADYPGLAFAVIEPDGAMRSGAVGKTPDGKPFTAQTPVALYSVAKTMTATLALMLARDGKLDLDKPIGTLAPGTGQWSQTTARQLLTHTSGMRHYKDGEWLPLSRHHCATTADALKDFIGDAPAGPAGQYRYSTFGYVLLSHVLATAAGRDFPALFTEKIAAPSGGDLSVWNGPAAPPPNGFEPQGKGFKPSRAIDNSCKFGAGAISGSAEDLARFGAALASGKLMPVEAAMEMVKPAANDGRNGWSWGLSALAGGTSVATHSGSAIGGTTAIAIDLRSGRVAAIVGAVEGPNLIADAKRLLELAEGGASPPG